MPQTRYSCAAMPSWPSTSRQWACQPTILLCDGCQGDRHVTAAPSPVHTVCTVSFPLYCLYCLNAHLPRLFVGVLPHRTVLWCWDLLVEYEEAALVVLSAAILHMHAAAMLRCTEGEDASAAMDTACRDLNDIAALEEAVGVVLEELEVLQLSCLRLYLTLPEGDVVAGLPVRYSPSIHQP